MTHHPSFKTTFSEIISFIFSSPSLRKRPEDGESSISVYLCSSAVNRFLPLYCCSATPDDTPTLFQHHLSWKRMWPYPPNKSHWYFSWNFDVYTLVKSIHFPFKWYQTYANLPTGSKVIDKSIWPLYRVPFWEIGLRKFVSHTTVLQQLQFKMSETVIKHCVWPLKVMFLNRKMLEAPDLDENWKSIFLTCRSKFVALCIVTEYQSN